MRAVIVCVDYWDILSKTLPYNREHFNEVLVITSPTDYNTRQVAYANACRTYNTSSFWANGAHFNKWLPLEQGLDWFGREGWVCLLDADILWPKHAYNSLLRYLRPGFLYCPRRRMCLDIPKEVPDESTWKNYPLHPQDRELAGYSQIFHASDPVLGTPPWHQTDWKTAGGADSFFQAKWPVDRRIRPPFEVLHLGESGVNWAGRSEEAKACLRSLLRKRGTDPRDRFFHERIKDAPSSI